MSRTVCSVTVLLLLFSLTAAAQGRRVEFFEGREAVPGEVLVRFRNLAGPQAMAVASLDSDIVSSVPVGRNGTIRLRSRGRNVDALLRAYRTRIDVLYAEPNYIWRATGFPNDELISQQWALKNTGQDIQGQAGNPGADIGAVSAWSVTEGSHSIVIGVVDGGIDYNHPDLAPNIWSAPAPFSVVIGGQVINCAAGTHGFNAVKRTCDPMDEGGHGTHVAGAIGAAGNNGFGVSGVSPIASLMPLKFLDADGIGNTADAVAVLEFAVQVKAIFPAAANVRVLNNSWGNFTFSQAVLDAVTLTNANDMLFVTSAGNLTTNTDLIDHYPSNFKVANVVSVAATDNRDALADFSNWGPTTVHLAAPGVEILSTVPQGPFEYESGTSMSSALVSGAAALILSACPLTTAQLKIALINNVDLLTALTGRIVSGGRLNVFRALQSCVGSSANFDVTVTPGARQVELTQPSTFSVTVTATNGFSAPVNLALTNVPAGITATLDPVSVLGGSGSSILTLTAGITVEAGTYLIGVRATSGGIQHDTGVAVTVGFPIQPGQTISGELTLHDAPSPEAVDKYSDLYKLTLASATNVTIDLKSKIFDGFLYVRSSAGEVLFSDDDSGGDLDSRIQATLAAGTYSIEVTSSFSSEVGLYTLSVNTPILNDAVPYVGALGSAVSVTLSGERFTSPMTVAAGSGITVSNVNVINPTLATATFTISAGAAITPRNLTVTTSEGPSNPLTFTVPPTITPGQKTLGGLAATDQIRSRRYTDIYQFNLTAVTAVTINMASESLDSYLYLLSSAGDILGEDDDAGFEFDARITTTLPPGTYFIEASSSFELETGSYTLLVNSPTLESITPTFLAAGSSNTLMTLKGTRFSGPATVSAGSDITVTSVTITNSTTITARFTVSGAAATGSRDVTVTTNEGTTNAVKLKVVQPITGITAGSTRTGTLSPTDAESFIVPGAYADLYSFTTTSTLFAIHLTTDFPGHLALLSSSGDVLETDEDLTGSGTSQIFGSYPAGTYFIEVSSLDPRTTGSYTLGFNTFFVTSLSPLIGFQGSSLDVFFSGRFFAPPLTIDAGPDITVTGVTFTTSFGVTTGSARLAISSGAARGRRRILFNAGNGTDYFSFFVLPTLPIVLQGQTVAGTLAGNDQAALTNPTAYGDFYSVIIVGGAGTVEVSSPDFTVSLSEISPSGDIFGQSEGTTARLTGLSAGPHLIEVTSTSPGIGAYTLSVPGAPTLTSISPNVGARGTTFGVVLTGTNFSMPLSTSVSGVTFSNFNVYSPTLATAVVTISPTAFLGNRNVLVESGAGTSNTVPFNVVASTPVPAPESTLSFTRFFSVAELGGTGLAVVNPAATAAEVQFSMYNSSGNLSGFYVETVGARGQMARLASQVFPNATQGSWIEITSATPGLQGFWLDGDFTNVMDGSGPATKARELTFPLVTASTEVTIVSPTNNTVSVRIYDGNGTELGSVNGIDILQNGGLQFAVAQFFPGVNLDNARHIRVTGTFDLLGTSVIKDFPVTPSRVALNGVDSSGVSTEVNFPHAPTGSGWVSVAGITNLSTSPQSVTFTYVPNSGSPVFVNRVVAGRASIREAVDTLFGFAGATQDGWIKVTGTLPLTGFIVYGYAPTGGAAAVAVQATPRSSLIFSHVATGPQFNTGVALLNTTTRDANVEVYIMRRTGALVGGAADVLTASFTLRAGTKVARLLDQFVPASVNDDGFVFVRSTNDVPLYAFELFFTRDVKVIANVPAGVLPAGVSYSPPAPTSPLPPLTISSLSPPGAPVGTVITVNGVGFDLNAANNTVVFTTATAAVSVVPVAATSTTLTVAIPSTAVTGPVYFTTGGRFSNSVTLTVP